MANIPLKTIKFPGLDDTYTVPQVDDDLDTAGAAADAKATGDALTEINERLDAIDGYATSSDVGKALKVKTVTNGHVSEWEFGTAGGVDPADIEQAVDDYLDEHPVVVSAAGIVSVADYGAVGDGVTDDSAAIQRAVNDNYDVYFESNKTYYLGSEILIDHDINLHGGENTLIQTKIPSSGHVPNGIHIVGTKRFDTTLTSDYTSKGTTDNSSNRLTLSNMTGIQIGDIIVIKATDQFYAVTRQYFYLGATLEVTDVYDGHIYVGRSMPWDIENTENVTVSVYAAPQAYIHNLNFRSELDFGTYNSLIKFEYCRSPQVKNCNLTNFAMGMYIYYSVNALIENVQVSKSKYSNSIVADGYGIEIVSCTNVEVKRVIACCAQSCVGLGGDIPNIDIFVRQCELASEARPNAVGIHDNTYSLTVEDCVLGGLDGYGNLTVNRCTFMRNNRVPTSGHAISYKGRQDAKWSNLTVSDCDFGEMQVTITSPGYQSEIASFDCVFGRITIQNCRGGSLSIAPIISDVIISNTIKEVILSNWVDCAGVKWSESDRPGTKIEYLQIAGCDITNRFIVTDNNEQHGVALYNIQQFDFSDINPLTHKTAIDKPTRGEKLLLPEGVTISVSSDNTSANYVVCGSNLVSDNVNDFVVGSVSGNEGNALVRTPATGSNRPTISINSDGDLVFNQNSTTGSFCIYPVGMFYVNEYSVISMGGTLADTGTQGGMNFRAGIAIVDCKTGKVKYRGFGTAQTASSAGVEFSHRYGADADTIVLCYYYCTAPIAGAQVTIRDRYIICENACAPAVPSTEPYQANRRTGDGNIVSVSGINHIMCSADTFSVKLHADYINNPIGVIGSAVGVNF